MRNTKPIPPKWEMPVSFRAALYKKIQKGKVDCFREI